MKQLELKRLTQEQRTKNTRNDIVIISVCNSGFKEAANILNKFANNGYTLSSRTPNRIQFEGHSNKYFQRVLGIYLLDEDKIYINGYLTDKDKAESWAY